MSASQDFRNATAAKELGRYSYAELVEVLGQPDRVVLEMDTPNWHGPKPALGTDEPAVVQAMARCLTFRAMRKVGPVRELHGVHPRKCGWCDYETSEIQAAVTYGGFVSGRIATEYAVWDGMHGSQYARSTPRDGSYLNPRWANFFANVPDRAAANDERRRLVLFAMYGDEIPAEGAA